MGTERSWPPRLTRLRFVQPVLQMLAALGMVVVGVRSAAVGSSLLGIFLIAFGGVTAALASRQLISRIRSPERGFESSGELATDEFDYIVWTALGLPVLLVLGLLILVVTGSQ